MECNEKVSKELKKDCHRKEYIRSRDAETPFQVMSYSTMTFQESEIYGEDVLEDTECNVEESVMQRMDNCTENDGPGRAGHHSGFFLHRIPNTG